MPRPHDHQTGLQARRNSASVTALETRATDIETKTDHISVTGSVDLDDVQLASETPVNLGTRLAALEYQHDVVSKTADYTALTSNGVILVDSNAGTVTITLPTAVGNDGKRYTVKLIEATNTCIVDGDGTETIDAATTKTLTSLYETVTIISDGSNWWII